MQLLVNNTNETTTFSIPKSITSKYNTSITNLSQICPISSVNGNICIYNHSFITNIKQLSFDFRNAEYYLGHDIKKADMKYLIPKLINQYNPNLFNNQPIINQNISLIILHSQFPTMFWEVFSRIIAKLFEYYILTPILFNKYDYLFVLIYPDISKIQNFHNIFLDPFTNYKAILTYIDLLDNNYNITNIKHNKYIKNYSNNFYDWINFNKRNLLENNNIICFNEIYFCGLYDKRLKSVINYKIKNNNEIPLSWDISRFIKWYYISYKYKYKFNYQIINKKRMKIINILLINRNESNQIRKNRTWINIKNILKECNLYKNITLNIKLNCKIIYFENENNIKNMLIKLLYKTKILIGFHGSGLTNGIFLNEYYGTIIELLPYKLPFFKIKIMSWIFKFIPIRHLSIQLKKNENKPQRSLNIFNSPFKIEFDRLLPVILWDITHKFKGCNESLPNKWIQDGISINNKSYYKNSLLYEQRPRCLLVN